MTSEPTVLTRRVLEATEAMHGALRRTMGDRQAMCSCLGEVLAEHTGAELALHQRTDLRSGDTVTSGSRATPELQAVVRHQMRRRPEEDPVAAALAAGDLRPRSALRALGPEGWEASPAREYARNRLGMDHVATLPVHGSPDGFELFYLAKTGDDFSDDAIDFLAAVQPLVISLCDLVESALRATATRSATDAPRLTEKERETLHLLAKGLKASAIARASSCSERTVHHRLGRLYAKLGVSDRLSAVVRAIELGLVARP
jgi:DNA-binding CsgD family transcriptional regulator